MLVLLLIDLYHIYGVFSCSKQGSTIKSPSSVHLAHSESGSWLFRFVNSLGNSQFHKSVRPFVKSSVDFDHVTCESMKSRVV